MFDTDILLKRELNIEITKYNQNGGKDFYKEFKSSEADGGMLNAKFNFQKYIGNTAYGSGKVSICGLDKQTIETLTGFADIETELNARKIIKLYAGYEGKQLGLMVDGSIVSALPTMPPDIWLNCEVINNYEQRNKTIEFATTQSMTLEDYIKAVADKLNLRTEVRIKEQSILKKQISKQSMLANMFQIANSVTTVYDNTANVIGIVAYIENETLVVDYSLPPASDERIKNVAAEISKDTGMIGLPELAMAGHIANITTLIDTSIKTGNVIKLKSEAIPAANGLYYVIGITYTGEFRGNAWYSMFHCRRIYTNG